MFVLLIILSALASVVALFFVAGLFIRKDYALEQRIIIARRPEEVFDFIRLLKNQDHYNIWWRMDPQAKKEFKGTDGTVGCIAAWESANKKVGKGEQEIINLETPKRIDYEIRFKEPFAGIAHTHMVTAEFNSATTVTWGFNGINKYPMNAVFALLGLGKALEKDIHSSLLLLKITLEK